MKYDILLFKDLDQVFNAGADMNGLFWVNDLSSSDADALVDILLTAGIRVCVFPRREG